MSCRDSTQLYSSPKATPFLRNRIKHAFSTKIAETNNILSERPGYFSFSSVYSNARQQRSCERDINACSYKRIQIQTRLGFIVVSEGPLSAVVKQPLSKEMVRFSQGVHVSHKNSQRMSRISVHIRRTQVLTSCSEFFNSVKISQAGNTLSRPERIAFQSVAFQGPVLLYPFAVHNL